MLRTEAIHSILTEMQEARTAAEARLTGERLAFLAERPALGQAERQMARASLRSARSRTPEAAREAREARAAYQAMLSVALREAGLPEDAFSAPKPRCSRCGDTGYTGEGLCDCVRNRLASMARQTYAVDSQKTFAAFDESLLNDSLPLQLTPTATMTQRQLTCRIRDFCRDIALRCPENRVKTLVLEGGAGLGKTYLLHCMANALFDRSVGVMLVDGFGINRAALDRESRTSLQDLCTVPVLLADDLGAEPMLQKVTGETLFMLLNLRQNNGLTTVFSTNLTKAELRERYGERFTSRLSEKDTARWLRLLGEDLRRLPGKPLNG